ncbi:hypothetical protein [Caballeronia sp. 15711]|uniref:hypothetical protein n=1 Tax=Caballeronia sp. 15711 TaxID=3391029 RepID=UPI0039E6A820
MKKNLLASLLIAATASITVPAFASGYGPAPSYRPSVGAPVSQQGINTQTIAAQNNAEANSYGGARNTVSQSGSSRDSSTKAQSVFFGQ